MNRTKLTDAEQAMLLAHLLKNYEYEPEKGCLRNKRSGRIVKGSTAGRRYMKVNIRLKGNRRCLSFHLAVWTVCHGRWPAEGITLDHLNGNKLDNRIENLRECSPSENNLNMYHPWRPNKDTGVPGVSLHGSGVKTEVRGKTTNFPNPYEAFFFAVMCGKKYMNN